MSNSGSRVGQAILHRCSLDDIGYETAVEHLQQPRKSISGRLIGALKNAECELRQQSGREAEAIRCVRAELETFGAFTADQVLQIGEDLDRGDHGERVHVQALVLYHIAHQIYLEYRHHYSPEDVAAWNKRLLYGVRIAAYDLSDDKCDSSKRIAVFYGAELAEKLLYSIQKIDISEELQRRERAVSTYHIADIYFRAEQYPKSLRLLEEATDIFKDLTCETEYDHDQYCRALWTLGNCYFRLKNFAQAEKQYMDTVAEVQRLPATAANWLKITIEDVARTFLIQGKDPFDLETRAYVVRKSERDLIKQIKECKPLNTLESFLEIACNELRLQRRREERSIQRVETKIFTDGFHTPISLLKMSEHCDGDFIKQKVKALVLIRISHKLFQKKRHSADETVVWIKDLVQYIHLTAYDLAPHESAKCFVTVNYGVKYAEFLLRCLLDIHSMSEHVEPLLLHLAIARCLYHIANIYFRVEDYVRSWYFFQRAKVCFTVVLPFYDRELERYCLTLWNIGNCYFRLRRYGDAVKSFTEASSEIEKLEMSSPIIKRNWLNITENSRKMASIIHKKGLIWFNNLEELARHTGNETSNLFTQHVINDSL